MDTLQFQKNPETAAKMSAYMKHQFVFAGIPAPERQALSKQLLKKVIRGQRKNYAKRLRLIIKKQNENISMSLLI